MEKVVEAIYEHGVLKLVKPSVVPGLKEHEQIKLIIIPKEEKPRLILEELLNEPPVVGSVVEMAKAEVVEDV